MIEHYPKKILFTDEYFEHTYLIDSIDPVHVLKTYASVITAFARPKDIESLFIYSLKKDGYAAERILKHKDKGILCNIQAKRMFDEEQNRIRQYFVLIDYLKDFHDKKSGAVQLATIFLEDISDDENLSMSMVKDFYTTVNYSPYERF